MIRDHKELKEKLKKVMEDPKVELEIFKDLDLEVPPAETFMKGKPHPARTPVFKKAAAFVVVFLLGTMLYTFFYHSDIIEAGVRKFNPKQREQEWNPEDRSLFSSSIDGAVDETFYEAIYIGEDQLKIALDREAGLLVPAYIPKGYVFDSLTITETIDSWQTEFRYSHSIERKTSIKLTIRRLKSEEHEILNGSFVHLDDAAWESDSAVTFHEVEGQNNKLLYLSAEGSRISISADLSQEDMEAILRNWIPTEENDDQPLPI